MSKPSTMNPFNGMAGGSRNRRGGGDWYSHLVVTGAGGAVDVANSDTINDSRMTVAKTAATVGRYTVTLPDKYRRFGGGFITIIGPNTANYGANTTGMDYVWRANDIDGGNLDGTVELQFTQASYADAEIPDNTKFIVTLLAMRGI